VDAWTERIVTSPAPVNQTAKIPGIVKDDSVWGIAVRLLYIDQYASARDDSS
jgi:hypothetical protein